MRWTSKRRMPLWTETTWFTKPRQRVRTIHPCLRRQDGSSNNHDKLRSEKSALMMPNFSAKNSRKNYKKIMFIRTKKTLPKANFPRPTLAPSAEKKGGMSSVPDHSDPISGLPSTRARAVGAA